MTPAPYTTLRDVRRRLHLYLVALWGRPFAIESLSDPGAPEAGDRPRVRDRTILLPERMGPTGLCPAQLTYRAAAAHAAAHLCHPNVMDPDGLKPRQRVVIEALEDARIEYLALTRFPGLRRLWLSQYPSRPPDPAPFPALLWRLSRMLLLQHADPDDFWVAKGVRLFLQRRHRMHDPETSREIGLRLAHDLGQMRLAMDEGKSAPMAPYRDDNLHLWRPQTVLSAADSDGACMIRGERNAHRLQESASGPPLAFAERPLTGPEEGDVGRYVQVTPDSACLSYFQHGGSTEDARRRTYTEWHQRIGMERRDWCTVHERPAPAADAGRARQVLAAQRPLVARLRRVLEAMRSERAVRTRRRDSGDELDLDAAVAALADLRGGRVPDERVYTRPQRRADEPPTTLLLLDVSASVAGVDAATGRPVLELARDAALLLAQALDTSDTPLAVAGFRSNGRSGVEYLRVKGFAESFGPAAQARLYGLTGAYSTRMGAAIRHGADVLAAAPAGRRLLLMVTDGEPADIDVFDQMHLLHDARHAVAAARRCGVDVFGVGLQPGSGAAVRRIFGPGRFLVLDHLDHLPERLSRLFVRLSGRRL